MLLTVHNLDSYYGSIQALFGVTIEVPPKRIIAVIGANGAGKSTLLNCIVGLHKGGAGTIVLGGNQISGMAPEYISKLGVAYVPEGRRIFSELTVAENIRIGAIKVPNSQLSSALDYVYGLFPKLWGYRRRKGGSLSGGEQQMLALARALVSRPQLLLLDEPSLGLAPIIVDTVFDQIASLQQDGVTTILVEQNAQLALEVADYGYVLERGKVVRSGAADVLLVDKGIREAYFGIS